RRNFPMKNRFRVVLCPAFLLFGLVLIVTASPAVWAELPPVAAPPKAQWGPDIRVNVVPDQATNKYNNMAVAINPTDPSKVLASYDDAWSGRSAYSWSTDAGRTWVGTHLTGTWGGGLAM